jgi:hypothetical protein
MSAALVDVIVQAIKQIRNRRFYCSERGFQGELKSSLDNLLRKRHLFSDRAIIEEEYQKTIRYHHISHRPDLIVHIPFEEGIAGSREEGNFVALEIKMRAGRDDAISDFSKLDDYITLLKYPLGIFINMNSEESFIEWIPNNNIHVLNVLKDGQNVVVIHSSLENEKPLSRKL